MLKELNRAYLELIDAEVTKREDLVQQAKDLREKTAEQRAHLAALKKKPKETYNAFKKLIADGCTFEITDTEIIARVDDFEGRFSLDNYHDEAREVIIEFIAPHLDLL